MMINITSGFDFDVLLDDSFANICTSKLNPIDNKKILSLINDFEDGAWREEHFQNFIWDNIAETALSVKEREKLISKQHSFLTTAAKNLRLTDKPDDVGGGSELAEILLYGIMRNYFGALPVVPKIFYKQNVNDYAKGADSVHIVINGSDFTIWFGEAKFYNSIEDARLTEIVKSVGNALQTDKLKKENSIITNLSDIDLVIKDSSLSKSIKGTLAAKLSIDLIKPRLHVPIMILHECDITRACKTMSDKYRNEILIFHKERAEAYFKKQITKLSSTVNLYSKIQFHIILFPVPSKKNIVKSFLSKAALYAPKKPKRKK